MPSTASVAVIDVLNSLLEAELNSILRVLDDTSPYLSQATAEIRRPVQEMVEANDRHAAELAELIDRLEGRPIAPSPQAEEQYLAFLSLKFLLPKLADAKRLMIDRYANALRAVADAERPVRDLLERHLAAHQEHLAILEAAAARAA